MRAAETGPRRLSIAPGIDVLVGFDLLKNPWSVDMAAAMYEVYRSAPTALAKDDCIVVHESKVCPGARAGVIKKWTLMPHSLAALH